MPLSVTSDIKDQIALLVANKAYAGLTSNEALGVDKAADRALATISQYAESFGMLAADAPTDDWEYWLVYEAAVGAGVSFKPERLESMRRTLDEHRESALSNFSQHATDGTSATPITFSTVTIRQFVMENCMKGRPRVFPSVGIIDNEIQDTIIEVWGDANWKFRRQRVTINFATDATVTTTPSVVIGSINKNRLKYSGGVDGYCESVTEDQMSRFKSTTQTAGKPEGFRLLKTASSLTWTLTRTPDIAYTLTAEVVIDTPAVTTIAEMDTAIGLFPPEFKNVLKKRVLGKVLRNMGEMRRAGPIIAETDETIAGLLPIYDDVEDGPATDTDQPSMRWGLGPPPFSGTIGGFL